MEEIKADIPFDEFNFFKQLSYRFKTVNVAHDPTLRIVKRIKSDDYDMLVISSYLNPAIIFMYPFMVGTHFKWIPYDKVIFFGEGGLPKYGN